MSLKTIEWVRRAYKKLKNAVYYDKTQLPLMDALVSFEEPFGERMLLQAAKALDAGEDEWDDYISDIIDRLDVLIYPKKLKKWEDSRVIFNRDDDPIRMTRAQYFIDLPVSGQLLGVLWILTVGVYLDDRNDPNHATMYEHSYGNRLRKTLYNENDEVTYSPYLFEPYFSQYQSWRDIALSYAEQRLDAKQDALILMLDLRSFFYSVHISDKDFFGILNDLPMDALPLWTERLHQFVYRVLAAYSDKLRNIHTDPNLNLGKRVILPIGFFPSNILSNWFLTPLDDAINNNINPVYYGRYVDDIIIVDKVEKNSELQKKAREKSAQDDGGQGKLTEKDVIAYYFRPVSDDYKTADTTKNLVQLLSGSPDDQDPVYRVLPQLLSPKNEDGIEPDIRIHNDKVKVFYFREGSTRALLDCFRAEIGSNASEFRFLPNVERLLDKNDYSEIFKLQNTETPNKLRGVSKVEIDRFSLSKFLGKYRKAGSMIHDAKENAFDRDLLSIFDKRTLIENYTLWERLLEIMVVNNRIDGFDKLVRTILLAIAEFDVQDGLLSEAGVRKRKDALLLVLHTAICRTSALCWGKCMEKALGKIEKYLGQIEEDAAKKAVYTSGSSLKKHFSEQRIRYCRCRMINKYVLPIPIDYIDFNRLSDETEINLCRLKDYADICDFSKKERKPYDYYPYMITPQEISHFLAYTRIACGEKLMDAKEHHDAVERTYRELNYPDCRNKSSNSKMLNEVDVCITGRESSLTKSAILVSTPHSDTLKLAIGNAKLDKADFDSALTGHPNRSYERYQQLYSLLRLAIKENVQLLVLPECFIPWEWLPSITSLCARKGMALVTGIEPVISAQSGKNKVYNLTAIILPYQSEHYKFAHITYHHKVHYSPEEKRSISGYRMEPFEGNEYHLFSWKDIWFSVYCCYELTSIKDRSLFQSLADLTVAVEWNRDVPYFSNIMESLCRDIHCYCVQVNSSEYGDSRVLSPSKTALRNMIQTKGGLNHTILTGEIDIKSLREYQRKEYELQRDDDRFKPTPPNLEKNIICRKQDGTLWNMLKREDKQPLDKRDCSN